MSNQEQKNQDQINKEAGVEKRRRFIKGAGLAAPVIMALANRPAFGGQVCTVSGYISVDPGNLSAAGHIIDAGCGGKLPAYWALEKNYKDWPANYYPKDKGPSQTATLMGAAFNYSTGGLAGSTLLSVLEGTPSAPPGATDPTTVYKNLVAALLSAAKGLYMPVSGLTVAEIQSMYKQISTTNQFEVTSGVFWTPAQLVSFLQQTMS